MSTNSRQSKGRAEQQSKAWEGRASLQRKLPSRVHSIGVCSISCEMVQTSGTLITLWPARGAFHPSLTHQGMQHLCPCLQCSVVTYTGKEKLPGSHEGVKGRSCFQPASPSLRPVLSGCPSLGSDGLPPHLEKQLLSRPVPVGTQCKHNYVYCLFRKK